MPLFPEIKYLILTTIVCQDIPLGTGAVFKLLKSGEKIRISTAAGLPVIEEIFPCESADKLTKKSVIYTIKLLQAELYFRFIRQTGIVLAYRNVIF